MMNETTALYVLEQMRLKTKPDAQIKVIRLALARGKLGDKARALYEDRLVELTA